MVGGLLFKKSKKKKNKSRNKAFSLKALFGSAVMAGFMAFSSTPAIADDGAPRWRGLQDEAVLVVGEDGRVFSDVGGQSQVAPASTVKLMTLYLLMETIHNGDLSYDDQIVMSPRAASIPVGYRQTNMSAWDRFSVDYALRAMFVYSANDVASSTGARISEIRTGQWSEDRFVELMNEKARELGMENTHFVDASGMSNDNVTTPYDMSVLARSFVRDYPELFDGDIAIADYPSEPYFERPQVRNTNGLLRDCPCEGDTPEYSIQFNMAINADDLTAVQNKENTLEGGDVQERAGVVRRVTIPEGSFVFDVDGLKTGFTSRAGFSIVASSVTENPETGEDYRIYVTYFGGASAQDRNEFVVDVLSTAYSEYYRTENFRLAREREESMSKAYTQVSPQVVPSNPFFDSQYVLSMTSTFFVNDSQERQQRPMKKFSPAN